MYIKKDETELEKAIATLAYWKEKLGVINERQIEVKAFLNLIRNRVDTSQLLTVELFDKYNRSVKFIRNLNRNRTTNYQIIVQTKKIIEQLKDAEKAVN